MFKSTLSQGSPMKFLSIGEVAKRTGLRASALRYYESEGMLRPASRMGGRRRYDEDVIRRIDVLRFAQAAGFSLKDIKTLLGGIGSDAPLSTRWQSLARAKMKELDVLAASIERMRSALELGLKCGCVRVEDCLLSPDAIRAQAKPPAKGCSPSC